MTVSIKPLEWHKQAMSHSYGLFIRLARTSIGNYQVSHGASGKFEVYLDKEPISAAYDGVPEAKAAAQADYEARISSALSAQVHDVAGWQPIETAPKDGTPVILWTVWVGDEISPDPFSEVQIGYWDHGNDLPESHDFSRRPEWVVQRIGEPTHWMPLPAAPAKQEGVTNE